MILGLLLIGAVMVYEGMHFARSKQRSARIAGIALIAGGGLILVAAAGLFVLEGIGASG